MRDMFSLRKKIFNFRKIQILTNPSILDQKLHFSLQQWILNYFQKTDNFISSKSTLPSDKKQSSELQQEYIKLLDYDIGLDDIKHNKITGYKAWDRELYQQIQNKPHLNDILKVLDFWANIMSSKCSYLKSYAFGIEFIDGIVKHEEIKRQTLVQCMHYVSLFKNNKFETLGILNTILNKLHKQPVLLKQFTLEEMCIFCNSLFATSTKIKSNVILRNVVEVLNENIDKILILENQHMLACLVKPLRLSKYYDYEILQNIAKKVATVKLSSSQNVAHFLALYSDALYPSFEHLEQFGYNFLQSLQTESKEFDVRIKDIDRFLWAFSNLGCDGLKTDIKEIIVPYLLAKTIKVKDWPAYFVNSLLWLQMLQCSSAELVKCVLTTQNLQIISKSGHLRNIARFSLLLSCLKIENKEIIGGDVLHFQQSILEPEMGMHLAIRKHLANVLRAVKCLQMTLGIKSVGVSYQIPCLYIAGITISTNRTTIEIEVLEESVCLHDSGIPHGLMKLKLRLMKRIGCKVILIDKKSCRLETERLFMHIEDLIKKEIYM